MHHLLEHINRDITRRSHYGKAKTEVIFSYHPYLLEHEIPPTVQGYTDVCGIT